MFQKRRVDGARGTQRRGSDRASGRRSAPRGVSNTQERPDEEAPSDDPRPAGFVSSMATEPIFQMFPEATEESCVPSDPESGELGESDRFLQKHYPMLYMNVSAREHPSIESVRCEAEETRCLLCRTLDRNTLDSVRVLEPHEVAPYLNSCGQDFTEKQVNVHLAHSVGEENLAGVLQNMSVDLIAGSYSLASAASLRVMNRVQTHMGRVFFAADQDMAKVHNDAVKQFMGLAATCQSLMKQRQGKGEKGPVTSNSSSSSSSYSSSSSSSPHPLL